MFFQQPDEVLLKPEDFFSHPARDIPDSFIDAIIFLLFDFSLRGIGVLLGRRITRRGNIRRSWAFGSGGLGTNSFFGNWHSQTLHFSLWLLGRGIDGLRFRFLRSRRARGRFGSHRRGLPWGSTRFGVNQKGLRTWGRGSFIFRSFGVGRYKLNRFWVFSRRLSFCPMDGP